MAMRRRDALALGLAAVAGSATEMMAEAADAGRKSARRGGTPAVLELRRYLLSADEKRERLNEFWNREAIPLLERSTAGPIGVFQPLEEKPDERLLLVLIPHASFDAFAAASERLSTVDSFNGEGRRFVELPSSDPPYLRRETSLMIAFDAFPGVEVPPGLKRDGPRLFELRTYESHNERAHRTKVEMFEKGEIDIFRRTGLAPVFFGRTVAGSRMPNLTYMLGFPDMDAKNRSWQAFVNDPEWKTLRATPGYADREIVSKIDSLLLKPTSASRI